jgi:hypothetical protein
MSYYDVDYYTNPMPYYVGRSATKTVPGWGQLPSAAGNARIGVGAVVPRTAITAARQRIRVPEGFVFGTEEDEDEDVTTADDANGGIPWWVWIAAPGLLAGGLALAVNMGWIGEGA